MTNQKAFALKEFLLGMIIAGAVGALFFHVITAHNGEFTAREKNIAPETKESIEAVEVKNESPAPIAKDCDKKKIDLECKGKYLKTKTNGKYDVKVTCKVMGCHPDVVMQISPSFVQGDNIRGFMNDVNFGGHIGLNRNTKHKDGYNGFEYQDTFENGSTFTWTFKNVDGKGAKALRGCSAHKYKGTGDRKDLANYEWIKGNATNMITIPNNGDRGEEYVESFCHIWYPADEK